VNTINTTLSPDLDFDFGRDVAPVTGIARVPLIVEVHPSVPARSIAELIAYARANPRRLRVAYAGTGTPQHVAIELFQHVAGVRVALVPYPGSAQALADLLRGEADVMFDPAPSSMPIVRAGRLVALATTGPTRAEALPDLPTMAEVLPGYEGGSWFGLPRYSNLAITTTLTLRAMFRLALRQTEGLIGSILQLLGLDLAVPDHSTLSRRAETLEVPRLRCGHEPVHLLVDSTGLRLCGPGEWLIEKHGTRRRRSW
jgi:tripartite-type tricarboxylate transporter receptor subunit TctC